MKKLIFFSTAIFILFSACKKDEIDLNKVDTIVIKGRFLSSETGAPLSADTLSGVYGSNSTILSYRMPNSKFTPPVIMRDKVSADGSYEFYVDSVAAFVQKQGINFVGFAPNHTSCDTVMNRCSMEPTFKMPFSVFEQKQVGTTLFLTYNIKLMALADVNFAFTGLAVNDSLTVNFEQISPCSGRTYAANLSYAVRYVNSQYPNYYGLSGLVPNRDYKVIISKFRDNKIVKMCEWTGRLAARESRQVPLKLD